MKIHPGLHKTKPLNGTIYLLLNNAVCVGSGKMASGFQRHNRKYYPIEISRISNGITPEGT